MSSGTLYLSAGCPGEPRMPLGPLIPGCPSSPGNPEFPRLPGSPANPVTCVSKGRLYTCFGINSHKGLIFSETN